MTGAAWALLVAAVWGISPIFEKLSLVKTAPFTVMTIRFMFTTAIVVVISIFTGNFRDIKNVDGMSLLWICLGGLVGGIIGLLLYFVVLKQNLASHVVPLAASFPLFTTFYAYIFLKEQISAVRLAGIVLVVVGIALINWDRIVPD
ncbi:MAG: EamA family transporter [Thermodesulfobacteriota bacterium]